MIQYIQVNTE